MRTGQKHFDTIIGFLKEHPLQNAKTIKKLLYDHNNDDLSQAQIYNIIKRMINDWVIVKENWFISLSMQRLQQVEKFVQEASIIYSKNLNIPIWSSKSFTASSLAWIDAIRSDISSKLSHLTTQKIYYYDPHPYHILWRGYQEYFDINKFIQDWKQIVYLLGHDTFLDKEWKKLLENSQCSVETSSLWLPVFYASIWEYWYTVEIAEHIYEYFELFFLTTNTIKEFQKDLFNKTFNIKWSCKLTVYHQPEVATELAQKILMKKL